MNICLIDFSKINIHKYLFNSTAMYIDWDVIWTNTISGVITGLFVVGVGYLVWRIQHRYTMRKECLTVFRIQLVKYSGLILAMYEDFDKKDYDNGKINNLNISFLENRGTFVYLFGAKYLEPTNILIDIFTKLKDKIDIKMTQNELDKLIEEKLLIFNKVRA